MDYQPDTTFEADTLQDLYARTLYSLRESHKAMLKQYAVASEADLLEKIGSGKLACHPTYEHYLGALIIAQTRRYVRAQAAELLGGAGTDASAEVRVHLMLKEKIEEHYADRLRQPVRFAQDALLLSFNSGLMMEVRYFSRDEYSIGWCWGEAELRVDTAPVHADCATFPQHLHDDAAALRADTMTEPGAACWLNFSRLIEVLLVDPLLESRKVDSE